MTQQNPAPSATNPVGDRRVQPDGPLSGEVKRGGDDLEGFNIVDVREPGDHPIQPTGVVYFIEATGMDRIKIGSAKTPTKRLKELQTGSPAHLRIVATIASNDARRLETRLHRAFGDARVLGEWFHITRTLRRVVDAASEISTLVGYRRGATLPTIELRVPNPETDVDAVVDGCGLLLEAVGHRFER